MVPDGVGEARRGRGRRREWGGTGSYGRESPCFLLLICLFLQSSSWEPRKAGRKDVFSSPVVDTVCFPLYRVLEDFRGSVV